MIAHSNVLVNSFGKKRKAADKNIGSLSLSIIISLSVSYEEQYGDYRRHCFRRNDGYPNAVQAPNKGEKEHRTYLEYERSEERDSSGDKAIVERCEER